VHLGKKTLAEVWAELLAGEISVPLRASFLETRKIPEKRKKVERHF
jgi:hypothetical protein